MASVESWNGQTAIVEHDGSCILILRRTYYPGWLSRVDDGPEQPVLKVNGGLQGVRLAGSGTSRVALRYRPTGLTRAAIVTLTALTAAVLILGATGWKTLRNHNIFHGRTKSLLQPSTFCSSLLLHFVESPEGRGLARTESGAIDGESAGPERGGTGGSEGAMGLWAGDGPGDQRGA